jgi:hypothetical protein
MKQNILTFLLFTFVCLSLADYQPKIHLSQLKVITLHKGRYTTSRRTAPVMQLKRVGGEAKTNYEPDTVQCTNTGSDGMSTQWKCEADLDQKYRFGTISVTCEGYDHPGDQNVLVGSCGLEYTLDYTSKGKSHERKKSNPNRRNHQRHHHREYVDTSSSASSIILFVVVFVVFLVIFFVFCMPSSGGSTTRTTVPSQTFTTSTSTNYYPNTQPVHHTTIIGNTGPSYTEGFVDGAFMSNRRGYYNQPSETYSSYESSAPTYDNDSDDDDDSTTRTATAYGGTSTR